MRVWLRGHLLLQGLGLAYVLLHVQAPLEGLGLLVHEFKKFRILFSLLLRLILLSERVLVELLASLEITGVLGQLPGKCKLHGLFKTLVDLAVVLVGDIVLRDVLQLAGLHSC